MRVLVSDLLQVPPSWAFARALSCSMLGFSWILLLVEALPSGVAALAPPPMVAALPAGPVEVPPVPSVVAEVPPAAPLPPLPTVALPPDEDPAPMVEALGAVCAKAGEQPSATAPAIKTIGYFICWPPICDRWCSFRWSR